MRQSFAQVAEPHVGLGNQPLGICVTRKALEMLDAQCHRVLVPFTMQELLAPFAEIAANLTRSVATGDQHGDHEKYPDRDQGLQVEANPSQLIQHLRKQLLFSGHVNIPTGPTIHVKRAAGLIAKYAFDPVPYPLHCRARLRKIAGSIAKQ
jgi:hypothetical protein